MTEQGYSNEEHNTDAVLEDYEQIELHGEDLEEYNQLQLPHDHPHVFGQAMLAQLARLPLMELDSEQELFAGPRVALSA